jgi:Fe-S-cluster containining protein
MSDESYLQRDTPFSYRCNTCCRCCHDKRIQLNPYEVARLARNLGVSTGQFVRQHMEPDVAHLKFTPEGACEFLTPEGCSVHRDRPLVCRLYPLGRHLTGEGEEYFQLSRMHPESEGVFGGEGTVEDFLAGQGVPPYLQAADRYLTLFYRFWDLLQQRLRLSPYETEEVTLAARREWENPQQMLSQWLDMDQAVANYSIREGVSEPSAIDVRMKLHLQALGRWLDLLEQEEER